MSRNDFICFCGHWSDKHYAIDDDGNTPRYLCRGCDCEWLREDKETMKDLENEHKQLMYDSERGK